MRTRFSLIVVMAIMLSGCLTSNRFTTHPEDAHDVVQRSSISFDSHRQQTYFESPSVYVRTWQNTHSYFLRASKGHTPEAKARDYIQLYLRLDVDRWTYFDRYYVDGKMESLTQINRVLDYCIPSEEDRKECTEQEILNCGRAYDKCAITESVGINLTPARLDELAVTGLDTLIAGKSGEVTFKIPAGFFEGFRQAMMQDPPAAQGTSAPGH